MSYRTDAVEDMKGATLVAIEGLEKGSQEVRFRDDDGRVWLMYHEQDCCECVEVEDVAGDLADLIGSPLTMSEEVGNAPEGKRPEFSESWTWTFYKFATVKGYVTLRWLGESNGFYGEHVDFKRVDS